MYAVKELWDADVVNGTEEWVHTAVFREKERACQHIRDIRKDTSRSYPLVDPKVVRVDEEFVAAWTNLAGNSVW